MSVKLHVRFGHYDGEPRDVHSFTFDTEGERQAFIDGMYQLSVLSAGEYDITSEWPNGEFAPDPEHEEE